MILFSFKRKFIRFNEIENFNVFVKFNRNSFLQLFLDERNSVNFVKKLLEIFDRNRDYVYCEEIRKHVFILFFEFIQHFEMFELYRNYLIFVLNRYFHECNNCDFDYV